MPGPGVGDAGRRPALAELIASGQGVVGVAVVGSGVVGEVVGLGVDSGSVVVVSSVGLGCDVVGVGSGGAADGEEVVGALDGASSVGSLGPTGDGWLSAEVDGDVFRLGSFGASGAAGSVNASSSAMMSRICSS